MQMDHINFNGTLFDVKQPVFTVKNRAFRYGDALFETIRVVNGSPQFLDKHVERMVSGMKVLKMNVPNNYTTEYFQQEILKLTVGNGIGRGGRVRITVYRDSDGFYTPITNEVAYVIEAIKLPENEYTLNKEGLSIDLYEGERKMINKLSSIKTNNSLLHVLAGIYKIEKNIDECLILNELGSVCESISSNIFVGFNNVLYTPSLNQGLIPGVMRSTIIELAKENRMEVQECPLNPQVLIKADEVFLTNSINGVKWVGAYRSKRYFSKTSRMLVDKLNEKVASLATDLQGN